jgi:hypothetical protein
MAGVASCGGESAPPTLFDVRRGEGAGPPPGAFAAGYSQLHARILGILDAVLVRLAAVLVTSGAPPICQVLGLAIDGVLLVRVSTRPLGRPTGPR